MPRMFFASSLSVVALGVGVFSGIWMDWRAQAPPLSSVKGRTIDIIVEPYEKANLVVKKGDTINWTRPDSKYNYNLEIDFASNDTPCQTWTTTSLTCYIDGSKPDGNYLYRCKDNSGGTTDCPDPGISPRGTGTGDDVIVAPPATVGYFAQAAVDFEGLVMGTVHGQEAAALAVPGSPVYSPPASPRDREKHRKSNKGTNSAPELAAVACNMGGNPEVTLEIPSGGSPDAGITVKQGQTLLWDGRGDTKLAFLAGNPCSGGVVAVSEEGGPWSCQVPSNQVIGNYKYYANTTCSKSLRTLESLNVIAGP